MIRARPAGKLGALLAGALLMFWALAAAAATDWPRPKGAVADYAGVLKAATKQTLEKASASLLASTGASLVVATIPELGSQTVEEAAARLYKNWGIGQKGQSKGLLMLLAVKDRRFRVEVGYGLEGLLPDSKVGLIIKRTAVPLFRKNSFDQGLLAGYAGLAGVIATEAGLSLDQALGKEASRAAERVKSAQKTKQWVLWGVLALVLGFLFFNLLRLRGRPGGGSDGFLSGILLGSLLGDSVGRRHLGDGGGFDSFGGGFGGFGGGMSGGGGASFDF